MEHNLLSLLANFASMTTVAQAIADFLAQQGTRHVFGTLDASTAPMVDQFRQSDKLNFTSCYRADAAILMADGYARARGAFAVALISGNKRSPQVLPAFVHALVDGSPVILITVDNEPQDQLARPAYSDDFGFACSSVIIASPKTAIQCLSMAIRNAMGARKFPVCVAVPQRFLAENTLEDAAHYRGSDALPASLLPVDQGLIKEAAELLAAADNPLIVLGGGAVWSGASSEAMELAEFLFAPIATSKGKSGIVPDDYPLSVGRLGCKTNVVAAHTLAETDVILALGSKLEGDTSRALSNTLAKRETKLIQVDIDARRIGARHAVQLGIVGDIKIVLQHILKHLKDTGAEKWPTKVIHRMQLLWERKAAWNSKLSRLTRSTETPIRRLRLIKDVSEEVGRQGLFFGEIEWKHGIQMSNFPIVESFDFTISGANLPLAMGALLALPDRRVATFLDNGQFMNVLGDLGTAVKYQIPVLIVVAHSGVDETGRDSEIAGSPLNYSAIASSIGAHSERVESPADIKPAIKRALASNRPAVVEAIVDMSIDPQGYIS